jgi:hypothetical protein
MAANLSSPYTIKFSDTGFPDSVSIVKFSIPVNTRTDPYYVLTAKSPPVGSTCSTVLDLIFPCNVSLNLKRTETV